jgi:Kef-type K+ transport system membrane component KefB
LGELLAGVIVGGSVLKVVDGHNDLLHVFAELGAVLLLFEVGLECDLTQLLRIGGAALYVAVAGVVLPFASGYGVAAALGTETKVAIFIGATLTATSVGITARVLADMKRLQTKEAQIVLGAAVADDIIGLIILAVVSGLAIHGTISALKIAQISAIAVAFLVSTMVVGIWAAPLLLKILDRARTRGVLVSGVMVLCLLTALLSAKSGLAPIVGAFAAGLLLARTEEPEHIQARIRPIAELLIPVFFVIMGAQIDVRTVNAATADGRATLLLSGLLFVVAVLSKVIGCGSLRSRGLNRALIGFGMVPRGEVGLIFAKTGMEHHILTPNLYTAIVTMVMATTLITPPLLKWVIDRSSTSEPAKEEVELVEAPQDVL